MLSLVNAPFSFQSLAAPHASAARASVKMDAMSDLKTLADYLNPAVGYWDPLELATWEFWEYDNAASIGWLRHAEIKHGRVAMAGFVGYIVHANGIHFQWKIPGDELCGQVSAPELWHNIPEAAKLQILLGVGFLEWWSEMRLIEGDKHYMKGGKPGYIPDFDATPELLPHWIGLNLYDPLKWSAKKTDKQVTS